MNPSSTPSHASTATVPAIEIKGLKKTYAASKKAPAKTALHGVDLSIPVSYTHLTLPTKA